MTATWRLKNGLARWALDARDAPAGDARQWLRDAAVTAVRLLDGFAVAQRAHLTTDALGDLEEGVGLPADDPVGALAAALREHDDIRAAMVTLALLLVTDPASPPAPFPGAGRLYAELEDDGPTPSLHLFLSIDTDIYAPASWGEDRDNHVLAARNGPQLTRYLGALQEHLGATVTAIDAIGYRDQVDATGFRPAAEGATS